MSARSREDDIRQLGSPYDVLRAAIDMDRETRARRERRRDETPSSKAGDGDREPPEPSSL